MIDNVVEILTIVVLPLTFYIAALVFILVLVASLIALIWRAFS